MTCNLASLIIDAGQPWLVIMMCVAASSKWHAMKSAMHLIIRIPHDASYHHAMHSMSAGELGIIKCRILFQHNR